MANLPEEPLYEEGIYQIEEHDPVMAGPDGIDNLQAKQLDNRTEWLKQEIESLQNELNSIDAYTKVQSDERFVNVVNQRNKNAIINGNFDIWQRGISQTATGYGSDDRWLNENFGSSKTVSREFFVVGQTDVPNHPRYLSRTIVSSVPGSSNHVIKIQKIEDVRTCSGETITLSFWAKADDNKNIVTSFLQKFGTGGSPSSTVSGIASTTHSLTTAWHKFTVTTILPSISGKTIGSHDNSSLDVRFWFDAGSAFEARTNSLGNQSGTFDIAQVQLERGSVATDFEFKTLAEEHSACERYYRKSYISNVFPGTPDNSGKIMYGASSSGAQQQYSERFSEMRSAPVVILYSPATGSAGSIRQESVGSDSHGATGIIASSKGFVVNKNSHHSAGKVYSFHYTADAEL